MEPKETNGNNKKLLDAIFKYILPVVIPLIGIYVGIKIMEHRIGELEKEKEILFQYYKELDEKHNKDQTEMVKYINEK